MKICKHIISERLGLTKKQTKNLRCILPNRINNITVEYEKQEEEVKCCGSCQHFLYECIDGDGLCEVNNCVMFCDNGEECVNIKQVKTVLICNLFVNNYKSAIKMETIREIYDFYMPKLIMMMHDPTSAMRFCDRYAPPHTKIDDITRNIPNDKVRELWSMVINSSFRENPNPIMKEMIEKLKQLNKK